MTAEFQRASGGAAFATKAAAESTLRKVSGALPGQRFDIFLSHSFDDATVIAGVKAYYEGRGLKVYVDWIDDPTLDRSSVTAVTADKLRGRMRACDSLIYATSEAAAHSKWMPWELGYFDGLRSGRIAIMPLVRASDSEFVGREYLGLYPKIERVPLGTAVGSAPYVVKGGSKLSLAEFRAGK